MLSRAALADFLKTTVLPCLVGLAGGLVFALLGLPAAWLSGALVAVTAGAFMGLRIAIPEPAGTAVLLLVGVVMGQAVTPDTLSLMLAWPISMAGLLVLVPAVVAAILVYLMRVEGFSRSTAFYGAIPGALGYVMALALGSKADMRAVTVVQSFRLVFLVAVLPSLIALSGLGAAAARAAAPAGGSLGDYLLLFVLAVSCGLGMERLRVPGGATVGAMLASAVLHGTGLVAAQVPETVMIAGFVVMGAMIAERFAGSSLAEFRRLIRPSFGAFVIGMAVTVAVAGLVALLAGLPGGKVILAYAPGGIEAMAILAYVLDMDPAFVGAHHIVRFLGIALALPIAARLLLGPEDRL